MGRWPHCWWGCFAGSGMATHADSITTSRRRGANGARRGVIFPVIVLIVFCTGQAAWQIARSRTDAASSAERIYATLVTWGADSSGLVSPVDEAEIERHIGLLWSDDGEQRVRAAHWLAARGVRHAGDEIAASMADPGTRRPCQLAHSLGKLGDEQWIDELLVAAMQPSNTDLRSCATLALTDIASAKAIDALIELTSKDPSRVFAVRALGEAGDARALEHLRMLRDRAANSTHRRVAEMAIERVELLSQADPVPDLLRRIENGANGGRIDEWALRHVARRADPRCVDSIARLLAAPDHTDRTRELLAAVLLACGADGRAALTRASNDRLSESREISSIALSLSAPDDAPQRDRLTAGH